MALHAPTTVQPRPRGQARAPRLTRPSALGDAPPVRFVPLLLALLLAAPALAGGPGFNFRIRDRTFAGGEPPAIMLVPTTTVKRVRLTLRRSDGKKIVLKAGRLPVGREKAFSWKQGVGQRRPAVILEGTKHRIDV